MEERRPPPPPSIERRTRLYPFQYLGVPLLLLVPALALVGVFGETRDVQTARGSEIDLRVDHPSRLRYKTIEGVHVTVRSIGDARIDSLTVAFDPSYLSGFSNIAFTPEASDVYEVVLTGVEPGELRRIEVELQGEEYGRHSGEVTATAGGGDTLRVRPSTIVFP